ncbi:MAG: sporulation protein YtfJ [Clostridia bacterium]|nr:sporulation protein YtfJ [Clostridia bacterium]
MQSVESIIETTMARLKTIVDVNTIVGEPIPAGNGVVVPVSKVSFGFFSGGGEYAPPGKVAGAALAEQKGFPFLGTAVAGVSLTPKAFLVTTDEGVTVVPANYDSTLDRLVNELPKFVKEVRMSMQQKEQEKDEKEGGSW